MYVIAEAGVNHNGSIDLAKDLIDIAADSGANAVKFQSFTADSLVTKNAAKADYQKNNTNSTETQYEMLKKLELSINDHEILIRKCLDRGIEFLSTPFDIESALMLYKLGISAFKIPSGEITNLPLLRCIGGMDRDVMLSTGMANLGEIERALEVLTSSGVDKNRICVLHATTEYPCPMEDVNLRAMQTISMAFGVKVGYSDHTTGIEASLAAVAMGARVIEKHFTLNRNLDGPDHLASIEPIELKEMIRSIRNISTALGSPIKRPAKSEIKNMLIARKSIIASKFIAKGELFSPDNLTTKRPGNGMSPMRWDEIIGTIASRSYDDGEQL